MTNGDAFAALTEEKITFPPTYKYEFASQEFNFKYVNSILIVYCNN